jgi:hypothetical protein
MSHFSRILHRINFKNCCILYYSLVHIILNLIVHTDCLMKNASTHNFVIYYPISMNKKIKDMIFQALQNSYKMFFFLA